MMSQRMSGKAKEFLARIAKVNPKINALVSVKKESELVLSSNSSESLCYVLKDNFCTKDQPTTCASQILKGFMSPYDSTVANLLRESGGTILGKANMDEFAMGIDNSYSCHGRCLNPLYDHPTSPGGSSGGSAAAVAAGFCDVSLGSDTGGSVRLPAAYCSVFGFKPSYGRISRYGLVSFAQSLDTVGILSRDLGKLEKTFQILDKPDEKDPTCAPSWLRKAWIKGPLKKQLKVGIVEETIIDMHPRVREAWKRALEGLVDQGHELELVSIPGVKFALPTYFALSSAEASSNLARYDGIRFGTRASKDQNSKDNVLYGPTRTEGFGKEVQRRILLGTFNMTAEAYDEHFLKAQKVRRLIINEFNSVFGTQHSLLHDPATVPGDIDVIVVPASPQLPPNLDKSTEADPVEHYIDDVLTMPANIAGLPAITVPMDFSVGIQVWGQYGDDELVLEVAKILEKL